MRAVKQMNQRGYVQGTTRFWDRIITSSALNELQFSLLSGRHFLVTTLTDVIIARNVVSQACRCKRHTSNEDAGVKNLTRNELFYLALE